VGNGNDKQQQRSHETQCRGDAYCEHEQATDGGANEHCQRIHDPAAWSRRVSKS
jgi:hypothetical protein